MSLSQSFFLLVLALLSTVQATQVMKRPANFNGTVPKVKTDQKPEVERIQRRATGKVSMGYFTNWGIYGANFQPTDIVPSQLSHILYAFADADASTGTISLTDSYADAQKHFPGDSWDDTGNNLYGCLKQLYLLKLANRNLKVLLSVGGWTYTMVHNTYTHQLKINLPTGHFAFVTSATARANFVNSAVTMIENYGFDGIDLDFEYPVNAAQGQGFADLTTALRVAFDNLAKQKGDGNTYELTAAVSAGANNYAYLAVPQMNAALSFWNLMAYDYAGSWLNYTDNQANLYGGVRTGVSTDIAVEYFLSAGATASKLAMGIPLYGRAFERTLGLGQSYSGIGPGTFEAGVYSYNVLPLAGATVFENSTDVTSYSYDPSSKEFVSYDTPNIVKMKAQYVNAKGLAGTMFWDLSTDKVGADSLVRTSQNVLGMMDTALNHINYPNSEWDNIRNSMGGSATTTTSLTTTISSTTSSSSTTTSSSGGGHCNGVSAWSSGVAYTGGAEVTYNGHLWIAKWWTEGDTPGGSTGVWTDNGTC